jgi:sugar O-acyltransferase (sialic acid O-acetyltransferase NeuD family)
LYSIAGILDRKEKVGENILGFSIIATDDDLDSMKKKCDCFAVTVGQIKTAAARMNIYNRLKEVNADLPFIVAATAHVSSFAEIGSGTMVFHLALINAGVKAGENCIINSGALIEHDAVVGNHCHISTSAVLNGNVQVKDESFIGSNASILQGITIGHKSIVGAGSVVLKNVADKTMVAGNPAKYIGINE